MDMADLDQIKIRKQDKLIVNEAYKRGVRFENISDKRFRMSYGNQSYIVRNGNVRDSSSTPLAIRVIKMKDVTSRILRNRGYNGIENTVFDHKDLVRAWYWASTILPVVLKPASGKLGKLVYVNINNYEEFKKHFEKIARKYTDILVEKYIEGEEYRFTYLNNQIITINRNIPAHVIGDGEQTINELIAFKNKEREKSPVYKKIKVNKESERILSYQGYNIESVPEMNKRVFVRKTSNLSTGGEAIDVTDDISEDIKEHVRKAINSIKGIFLCGADVLISGDKPYIMEINSLPGLLTDDYLEEEKPRHVIKKVVDEMFPETVEGK